MKSVEDCINDERRTLGQYVKHSQDYWLTTALNENVISVDEEPEKYKERIVDQKKEEWENKQM